MRHESTGTRIKREASDIITLDSDPEELPKHIESQSPIKRRPLRALDLNNGSNLQHSSCTSSSSQQSNWSESDYVLNYKQALKICSEESTVAKQGVALFNHMWENDIAAGMFDRHEYNIDGTSPNGSTIKKRPLNAEKVLTLRSFMEKQMPQGSNKHTMWIEIKNAIHKRLSYLGKLGSKA